MNYLLRILVIATTMILLSACGGGGDSGSSDGTSRDPADSGSNSAPRLLGTPPSSVTIGNSYSFTPFASDADGDSLIFSLTGAPSWISFDSRTGRMSGVPTSANIGTTTGILLSVTDGRSTTSLPGFGITVAAAGQANNAPVISGNPVASVLAGTAYTFTPAASDPDGNSLTFNIVNRPTWATFDTQTGRLSGTPSTGQAGTYRDIVITVSDRQAVATLAPFNITVTIPNVAPTISGTPATSVIAGQAYSFTPTASDANGDTLSFSITGRPTWATFNTGTGRLSGTPSAAAIHGNIVISVSDGRTTSALPAFSITVNAANIAPVISGSPTNSVTIGQDYSFTPMSSDANGDTLTFSITGRPAWAAFNTSTGRLSGTPTIAATHSNIVITVSDGQTTTSLPAFNITVEEPMATVTINWVAPTTRSDGTSLSMSEIGGYRIYYGGSPDDTQNVAHVMSSTTTSHTVRLPYNGTYYFRIGTYDVDGIEGPKSAALQIAI